MPTVWIPPLWRDKLTGGQETVEVSGGTVREIVAELEARFPGIRERLVDEEEDRIRRNIAVAVDGEVSREGMRRKVPEGAEVHFLPAMSGGSQVRG